MFKKMKIGSPYIIHGGFALARYIGNDQLQPLELVNNEIVDLTGDLLQYDKPPYSIIFNNPPILWSVRPTRIRQDYMKGEEVHFLFNGVYTINPRFWRIRDVAK